ncbi:MAG: hypothetical protein J6M35_08970 [Clostridia bacterium]|nr:hypothetical protein [Clostridia bacterium]
MKRIVCDFNKFTGKINPQHGAVNWPIGYVHAEGAPDSADCDRANEILREINFPFTRLKEPYNRGYVKCLEIPFVFRDFSKDESDPKNYYFYNTTNFVKDAANGKRKVMVRLGAPREYWKSRYNNKPTDYDKFARICRNVVRHINDGWANGIKAGVKYFEIWNRADDIKCWPDGSYEDYYRLYERVAREIKELHPRLKVGGPAAAFCGGDNAFLKGFLDYVAKNNVPCDFVTWNYYGEDAAEAFRQAKEVRKLVRDAKLPKKVEIFNDEWSCITLDETGFVQAKNTRNEKGAAFDAAFLMQMHKAKMDACHYYELNPGLPWGGLLGKAWKRPLKPIYAFLGFARLYALGQSVKTTTIGKNTYAMAAANGEKQALMISVTEDKRNEVEINFASSLERKIYIVDKENDFAEIMTTSEEKVTVKTKGHTVIFAQTV